MTLLNTVMRRGRSYDPAPYLAPPIMSADPYSWLAIQPWFNPTPSGYISPPLPDKSISERMFDARAALKLKTATLAAAHFTSDDRDLLFKHLDSLLDPESWDDSDVIASEASFTTLLRLVLYLGGRRPALGLTDTGHFIATWTEDHDRLTVECQPEDHVRYVLVHYLEDQRESTAGETTVVRLPEVLSPYDPMKRWFPNAHNQNPT